MKINNFIAHRRESDGVEQTLYAHLMQVGEKASQFAGKIGIPEAGKSST